ncbi:unnamed protein product [Tenebrio molitor]|nr:unnamed protein product [Tenebrio molitor]
MNDTLSRPLIAINTLGVCFIISLLLTFFNVESESQDVALTAHLWLISVTLSGGVMNLMLAFYSGQMITNLVTTVLGVLL